MPSLFRAAKDQPAQPAAQPAAQQPKLGYRSMVSVDDVPELFASLDSKQTFSLCFSFHRHPSTCPSGTLAHGTASNEPIEAAR